MKELRNYNVLVAASRGGTIFLWDLEHKTLISSYQSTGEIISGAIDSSDELLVLGSTKGVIRIFDISNQKNIKLIKVLKLLNN